MRSKNCNDETYNSLLLKVDYVEREEKSMEVEIKAKNIDECIFDDKTYVELKKLRKKLDNSVKGFEDILYNSEKIIEELQSLECNIENFEDIPKTIRKNITQQNLKTIKSYQELKMLQEETNIIEEKHKLQKELISILSNIIKRLEQEVVDLTEDRELIRKIVKEENMNCKSYDSAYISIFDKKLYIFIEPIIDFGVIDKIIVTDFIIRLSILNFTKEDELN